MTEDTGRVGTGSGRAKEVVVRLLGGINRGGTWRPARRTTLVTLVGGMEIDLAGAELPADGVELTKVSLIGGLDLSVPAETRLEVGGFTLIGGWRRPLPGEQANGPLVRVRCYGLVGGVDVHVR